MEDDKAKHSLEQIERILNDYCQQCQRQYTTYCRYCRIDPDRKVAWEGEVMALDDELGSDGGNRCRIQE